MGKQDNHPSSNLYHEKYEVKILLWIFLFENTNFHWYLNNILDRAINFPGRFIFPGNSRTHKIAKKQGKL